MNLFRDFEEYLGDVVQRMNAENAKVIQGLQQKVEELEQRNAALQAKYENLSHPSAPDTTP